MKSFILKTALLLCSLSLVSVSVSESETVEVQPGEEVTLHCSNMSTNPTTTEWIRVVNQTKVSCISSMYGSNGNPKFCDGFKNGKFKMSSNISAVFLNITQVDLSDSGLYLCGFYLNGHTRLKGIYLNVQEESDENTRLMSVILGGLTVFLLMVIISLVVKIMKLQTAPNEELNTPQNENLGSDNLNYAALSFNPKPKRNRRPVSGREVEPNVIYAATK
ncbi:uncharacterized protein LOC128384380 [Scomber japonicus]|uniref:uncharacterized protein LOC128384380 n=1 Tax=Scomber japonicus TaxID=13676 RepID=UPI0023050B67|nr:uncharacterized protein LOC128384380 [Scomber japonicus]